MSTRRPGQETEQEFTLKLKALSGWGWTLPPEQRLRGALKVLLRRFGLRATEIRPEPKEPANRQDTPSQ